jgi:hypothetical protein
MSIASGIRDPHIAFVENLKWSMSFWPQITVLEIALRNKLVVELEARIDREFLSGNNLILDERLRVKLHKLHSDPRKTGGSFLTTLGLGFWGMLLNKRYESSLWVPALRHAFSGLGVTPRTQVHEKLSRVILLRNRIAHHENILGMDFEVLYEEIAWLMERLEPGSRRFLITNDSFPLHPVE